MIQDNNSKKIIVNHIGTWKYKTLIDSLSIGRAGTSNKKPPIKAYINNKIENNLMYFKLFNSSTNN